jgi:hypothetical protein
MLSHTNPPEKERKRLSQGEDGHSFPSKQGKGNEWSIIMQMIFFINYNLFIIINKPLNRLHPIPSRSQLHE